MNKNNKNPGPPKIKNDGYRKKAGSGGRTYARETGNTDARDFPENKYYLDAAYKIKWIKWLSAVILVLFFFAGIIFNPKEVNAENLGYLLRYINIQGSNRAVKTEFQIELDESSSICYYKNNIAVLRKNRLDIYDLNGRKNFNSKLAYSVPVLKASDKYIIAYDLGTNKMEVFNSFSRIYEYKGDKPVYFAEVTNQGNIVYASSEKNYKSAVYVMNSGFNVTYRCLFEKDWVMCADIDDRAETLAVAGYYARDGDFLSRIILYGTKSEEPKKKIEVAGEIPYGIKLGGSGVFAVFENSFRCYGLNGDEISVYNFMRRKIQKIMLTSKLAAVVLSEKTLGTDDRILIFGGDGSILYDGVVDAEITDIKFSDDYRFLYFLTRAGLYKINIAQGTSGDAGGAYDETTNHIICANDKNIFLSGPLKINILEAGN